MHSMIQKFVSVLLVLFVFVKNFDVDVAALNVTILHTNDVHCRFLSYDKQSRPCDKKSVESRKCWGGAARRMTLINRLKSAQKNVLLLDAGDQYQGTMWFTSFGWKPIAKYMNVMGYDAMCLGNHEFDHGVEGLTPFLENITCPIVDSNIDSKNRSLNDLLHRSLIFKFKDDQGKYNNDHMVAIVGYTSRETPEISKPGPFVSIKWDCKSSNLGDCPEKITFLDEVDSLQKVVNDLQSQGINKIIALGHSGIKTDRSICQKVKGLDVVIGGHTNTFLYSGVQPSVEVPEGPYPEVYGQTGSPCLVVQAYAYGKYLGFLQANFDDRSGILEKWNGNPILIDSAIPENETIKNLLDPYAEKLKNVERFVIGSTEVHLDSTLLTCKMHECLFGNVVADAFVDYFATLNSDEANPATICIINSGGLREITLEVGQNITLGDLFTLMPFSDTVQKIKLRGRHLLQAMEHSVDNLCTDDTKGKFLQVAGLKVTYDISQPSNHKVVELLVSKKSISNVSHAPEIFFESVNPDAIYDVITNNYIVEGGNGYKVIQKNLLHNDGSQFLDSDVMVAYLKNHNPIKAQIEGRINFLGDESKLCSGALGTASGQRKVAYFLSLFAFLKLRMF